MFSWQLTFMILHTSILDSNQKPLAFTNVLTNLHHGHPYHKTLWLATCFPNGDYITDDYILDWAFSFASKQNKGPGYVHVTRHYPIMNTKLFTSQQGYKKATILFLQYTTKIVRACQTHFGPGYLLLFELVWYQLLNRLHQLIGLCLNRSAIRWFRIFVITEASEFVNCFWNLDEPSITKICRVFWPLAIAATDRSV